MYSVQSIKHTSLQHACILKDMSYTDIKYIYTSVYIYIYGFMLVSGNLELYKHIMKTNMMYDLRQ